MATTENVNKAPVIADHLHRARRLIQESLAELEQAATAWAEDTDPQTAENYEHVRDLVGATRLISTQVATQAVDWSNIDAYRARNEL